MVYNGKPIKMDDLGVSYHLRKHPYQFFAPQPAFQLALRFADFRPEELKALHGYKPSQVGRIFFGVFSEVLKTVDVA